MTQNSFQRNGGLHASALCGNNLIACEHHFSLFTGGFPLETYIQLAIQNDEIVLVAEVLLRLLQCYQICTSWSTPFMLRKLMIIV